MAKTYEATDPATPPDRSQVVLVGIDGEPTAVVDKIEAHLAPGRLHLAFSVFLYRADGRTLLQRRAKSKYHFPGYWANACCSHPGPHEDLRMSAMRRVVEELGITCELRSASSFVYRAVCPVSGLVEHELDQVFIGLTDAEPTPAPDEVDETSWCTPGEIRAGLPEGDHAPWLAEALVLAEQARAAAGWPDYAAGP